MTRDPLRPTPIADLLDADSADLRVEGLERLEREGDFTLAPKAVALLADDAPFVFRHGDRPMVAEVRFRALSTVETLYRLAKRAPDFGPVQVRKAMPADEAERRAAAVLASHPDADAIRSRAHDYVARRVQPGPSDRDAARAYRVLQEVSALDYRTEEVDPSDWLTPLQREVSASQTTAARPRPHLAVHGEDGRPLGYLYREGSRWALDFAEDSAARKAQQWVDLVLTTIEKGGVPRVVFDDDGQPRTSDDGSFELDGVIPHDTDDPVSLLRSVGAFTARRYGAEVRE